MWRIPCLWITSSQLSQQVGVGIKSGAELASHVIQYLIKALSPKKSNLENWLWKHFGFDKPTIHARKNFWNTPRSFFRWFSIQTLWRDPARRSCVSSFNLVVHSGSDWQFGVENKLMVFRRWIFRWWLQNRSERSQMYCWRRKIAGTWNSRNIIFLVKSLKNGYRSFQPLSKKSDPGSTHQDKWTYYSWFTARLEIAGRPIRKES